MKNNWTTEWPKIDNGFYWFYGYPYGITKLTKNDPPSLKTLRVQKISNGYMYVLDGHFIFEKDAIGKFLEIELPELPDIEDISNKPKKEVYAKGANPYKDDKTNYGW